MHKYDKVIGKFWVVYNQIYGKFVPLEDKLVTIDDGVYKLDQSFKSVWKEVREENNLSNKEYTYYLYGEVVFDLHKHTFVVYLCDELYADDSIQKRIIKKCGLSSYTRFEKIS